jgi:ABC-type multidrug transport system fused ATPase/permease subunit
MYLLKILNLFHVRNKFFLLILFFFYLISVLFDLVGISLVPLFLISIFNPEQLKLFSLFNISEIIKNLNSNYIIIFIFLLFLVKNIFLSLVIIYEQKLLSSIYLRNSDKIFKKYLYSSYKFHLDSNIHFLVRNIIGECKILKNSLTSFLIFLKEILLIIGIFCLLLYSNFIVTLSIAFVLLLFYLVHVFFIQKLLKNLSSKNLFLRGFLSQNLIEMLSSIKDIKITNKEIFVSKNFFNMNFNYEKNENYMNLITRISKFILEIIFVLFICLSLYFVISSHYSSAEIFSLISLIAVSAIRMLPSFSSLIFNYSKIKIAKPSLKLIYNELINISDNKILFSKENSNFFKEFNSIEFHNVSFKYTDDNVLKRINFKIFNNSITGIVGRSGSGKTTILNLLTGLLDPTEGKILLNGHDLINYKNIWFKKIAYVSQNIYLFNDTIKNNITFAEKENLVKYDLLKTAIKNSLVDEFFSKEINLETLIGNNGERLSGGQRQRLAIARALYSSPEVIILDESTNALDQFLEDKIIKNLIKLGIKNIILVTHNLNSLKYCNKIYSLSTTGIKEEKDYYEFIKSYNNININD